MINAIDSMAGKLVQKVQEETADPVVGELEEVKQKPDKNNVAEGNPTPDPPKVSDKDSIKDAVLVDPDEPKKKPRLLMLLVYIMPLPMGLEELVIITLVKRLRLLVLIRVLNILIVLMPQMALNLVG